MRTNYTYIDYLIKRTKQHAWVQQTVTSGLLILGPFLLQLRWKISTKLPRCQASFWSPAGVPPKYDISEISEISQLQPVHVWCFRYFRHCFKMMYPTKLEVMCGFCSWFRSTQWIVKIHEIGHFNHLQSQNGWGFPWTYPCWLLVGSISLPCFHCWLNRC